MLLIRVGKYALPDNVRVTRFAGAITRNLVGVTSVSEVPGVTLDIVIVSGMISLVREGRPWPLVVRLKAPPSQSIVMFSMVTSTSARGRPLSSLKTRGD